MYSPQRLHPAAILEFLIKNVYKLGQGLLPLIIVAIGQPGLRRWLLLLFPILLIFFVVYMVLYWLRYVYYVQDNELRLEYGVLVKKKRYISFDRIQTVQVSAGVIQRLFGLVKLQVETAGGDKKAELILPAVSRQRADELRQVLQQGRYGQTEAVDSQALPEYRLSLSALLLLSSTSNSLGVVLAGLLALASQLDEIAPQLNIWEILARYASNLIAGQLATVILVTAGLILLAWLLSLLGNIVKFGGFKLIREGDNFGITRGLLEQKQITIPINKIQAIKVVEGILRQPFGMVSIQVVSISNAGEKGEGNVLFPIMPRSKVESFLQEVIPEFAVPLSVESLPARARGRYILINFVPAALTALIAGFYPPWGYAALLLLPLAAGLGIVQHRDAGLRLQRDKLVIRTRWLGRSSTIVPRRRVQSLSLSQTYFQIRKQLSTVRVAIASGTISASVKLVGIDRKEGEAISQWYSPFSVIK